MRVWEKRGWKGREERGEGGEEGRKERGGCRRATVGELVHGRLVAHGKLIVISRRRRLAGIQPPKRGLVNELRSSQIASSPVSIAVNQELKDFLPRARWRWKEVKKELRYKHTDCNSDVVS